MITVFYREYQKDVNIIEKVTMTARVFITKDKTRTFKNLPMLYIDNFYRVDMILDEYYGSDIYVIYEYNRIMILP